MDARTKVWHVRSKVYFVHSKLRNGIGTFAYRLCNYGLPTLHRGLISFVPTLVTNIKALKKKEKRNNRRLFPL